MDDDYVGLNSKEEHQLLIDTIQSFVDQNDIYLYGNFQTIIDIVCRK